MSTGTIVWIIVAILVLAALVAVVAGLQRRRRTRTLRADRERAARMRQEADDSTVRDADLEAREAQLEADRARLEAEQAQARAQAATQGRAHEEARVEDQLREADRLDPDVDHRADDYSAPTDPSAHPDDTTRTPRPPA